MVTRNLGIKMSARAVKRLTKKDVQKLFDSPHLIYAAKSTVAAIGFLKTVIKDIENEVTPHVNLRDDFSLLQTIPGIDKILALTIMLEMDTIKRSEKAGNYSSYCRCVNSQRLSDGKKKGEINRKNGNRYLSWAHVEAANFAVRYNEKAKRFYQRKKSKRNGVVGIKALSNKIARASYYILRDQVPFDENRLFG
jgi:transposase